MEYDEMYYIFHIEEADNYRKLRKLFQTPTEIMEILKALIFTKDNVQPIVDGSTNKPVWFFAHLFLEYFH